jgi:GWxTD domain-containing protein
MGEGGGDGLSDVELCTRISPSTDRSSLFYRNTLEVIPNPALLYGTGLPVLHFYAEVYNLLAEGGGDVVLRAEILDPTGRIVTSSSKIKPRTNNSSVEYGSMNVSSLPGGSYIFRLSVDDSTATPPRLLARSQKRFFLLGRDTEAAPGGRQSAGAGDEFALMTAEAVDDEIRKIKYIASDPERDQIDGLTDPLARLNFLREFWKGRDPDPVTPRNEARSEYLGRVAQANDAYTERGREGWLTDRGRILILYGAPNDIERHPSEPETHPYEIWNYHDIQSGVEFVFVDVLGFGRYRLVHSSHFDELRNDNWYNDEAKIR